MITILIVNQYSSTPGACYSFRASLKCAKIVFVLEVVRNLWACSSANDLQGYECNIMNAWDEHGKPEPTSAHYLPAGLEKFEYVVQLSLKPGISVWRWYSRHPVWLQQSNSTIRSYCHVAWTALSRERRRSTETFSRKRKIKKGISTKRQRLSKFL